MFETPRVPSTEESEGYEIREKEEDLLRRQVMICQDAVKDDMQKFIGSVDMLEAMLAEDIEKMRNRKMISYDARQIVDDARRASGIKQTDRMDVGIQYRIALEKFRILYRVFKEGHIPIVKETRL